MRENRTYGSEGGEARAFPTPISNSLTFTGGTLPTAFSFAISRVAKDWRIGFDERRSSETSEAIRESRSRRQENVRQV